jgi:hypothetical protein
MQLKVRWFLLGIAVAALGAAPDAAAMATQPSRPRQIRQWVIGLMDVNPAVRDQATDELLGMKRVDLPVLKEALTNLGQLDPAVRQTMSQVVTHVYLSEEAYQPGANGFLGVRMPTEQNVNKRDPKVQIVIESRLAGFDAYRKLRNGDGILDLEERPLEQPPDRDDFIDKIGAMRAGEMVHLKVLREGKVVRVSVQLGRWPAEINQLIPGSADEFAKRRQAVADTYIKEQFGSLLGATR